MDIQLVVEPIGQRDIVARLRQAVALLTRFLILSRPGCSRLVANHTLVPMPPVYTMMSAGVMIMDRSLSSISVDSVLVLTVGPSSPIWTEAVFSTVVSAPETT